MKVVVRPLDDPSLEDGVASLRIQAYPQFPETRDIEFCSSAYRWFRRHQLGSALYRWVAMDENGRVWATWRLYPSTTGSAGSV